jgi:hypothetical protein
MEDFGAKPIPPLEACQNLAQSCDLFVGVIGFYYGSTPPGDQISFTEYEYRAAHNKNKLMFLSSEDFLLPAGIRENDASWSRQQEFREKIKRDLVVDTFNSPLQLAAQVNSAIANWRLAKNTDRPSGPVLYDTLEISDIDDPFVEWFFTEHFLGLSAEEGADVRAYTFEIEALNKSEDFIESMSGYIRSRISGEKFPMYFNVSGDLVHPDNTYGIPPKFHFRIAVPFAKPWTGSMSHSQMMPAERFLREIGAFTFVYSHEHGQFEKVFSFDEVRRNIEWFRNELVGRQKPVIRRKSGS